VKKILKISLTVAAFILVAFLISLGVHYVGYIAFIDTPNSDNSKKVEFIIEPGETVDTILENLVQAGLLRKEASRVLKYYIKKENIAQSLQAGVYSMPLDLTPKQIAETLQHAELPEVWVTIPEGLRKDEIADLFLQEFKPLPENVFYKKEFTKLTTDAEFIKTLGLEITEVTDLEGFLFPDKYLLGND